MSLHQSAPASEAPSTRFTDRTNQAQWLVTLKQTGVLSANLSEENCLRREWGLDPTTSQLLNGVPKDEMDSLLVSLISDDVVSCTSQTPVG